MPPNTFVPFLLRVLPLFGPPWVRMVVISVIWTQCCKASFHHFWVFLITLLEQLQSS